MNLMVLIIFLIYKVKFQFTVQSIIGATDNLKKAQVACIFNFISHLGDGYNVGKALIITNRAALVKSRSEAGVKIKLVLKRCK